MSRQIVKSNVSPKVNSQVPQRLNQNLQKYSRSAVPQTRDANLPVAAKESSLITTYKDLDQPARDLALNQKRQLIIGVFTFVVLGIGILMGQQFGGKKSIGSDNRIVASEPMSKMIPADASIDSSVQYEKTCFTESNGNQVCTTRVSTNRK